MSSKNFFEKYAPMMLSVSKKMSNNKYLGAKNNKFSRFLKLQIVKILFKFFQYPVSQKIYIIVGIDYLDLRNVELPRNRDLFYVLAYIGFPNGLRDIYGVKLPYIDYNYYNCNGVCFKDSIFLKPDNEEDLQSFIFSIHSLSRNVPVFVPFGDYSNVSFKSVDISETHFHRDCILSSDTNLFQNIIGKDLSKTELPLECLRNIHLYDLNGVKINFNLYEWYKDILTPVQINLIKNKYPTQIDDNIILPDII